MRTYRLVPVSVIALVVTACPGEQPPVEIGAEREPEPVVTEATRQADLDDLVGTGVSGELVVTPFSDSVVVHLSLNDAEPNATHGARLQEGTCAIPGRVVELLGAVLTGELGNGRSQRSIYDQPDRVMDGNHVAAIYAPRADPDRDRPIACAAIPTRR